MSSMEEWVSKMNFRSSMSAQQLFEDGKMPSVSKANRQIIICIFSKNLSLKAACFREAMDSE